jgi:hypothetical protein
VLSDAAVIASGCLRELDAVQHESLGIHLQYFAQTIGIFEAVLMLGAALAISQAQATAPRELTILTWLARFGLFLASVIVTASVYQTIDPVQGYPDGNARAAQIIGAISTLGVGAVALSLCLATMLHIRRSRR